MGNVRRNIFLQKKKKKPEREGGNTHHVKSYRGRGCVETQRGQSHTEVSFSFEPVHIADGTARQMITMEYFHDILTH